MSWRTIAEVIDEHLLTVDFDANRIGLSNVTYRPTEGRPYLVASMVTLASRPTTLGADQSVGGSGYVQQWEGTYQVEAVWPENAGADGCYQMQEVLLQLFPRGLTLITSDNLRVRFDNSSPLQLRLEGAWIRGPVRCPWWCLETT